MIAFFTCMHILTHKTHMHVHTHTCISGRLRCGDQELRLWQGVETKKGKNAIPLNPVALPASNPSSSAMRLTVKFAQVSKVPVLYPSTDPESYRVLLK